MAVLRYKYLSQVKTDGSEAVKSLARSEAGGNQRQVLLLIWSRD